MQQQRELREIERDMSFAESVHRLAGQQGVRCAPGIRGQIHIEEEDLRIESYHAKGHLGSNSDFDFYVHGGDDKIGRLYLQSIVEQGATVYVVPPAQRNDVADFFKQRAETAGLNGEIKVLDAWLLQLHRFEITWKKR